MTSSIFFFLFVPLLAFILLAINFIFAPHNPYQEKNGAFECGFTSFLGQNRTQFSISFFIFALLFLLFDLEILLVYPYLVSSYINESYGLVVLLIFLLALTLGFVFELGKKALTIDSRQNFNFKTTTTHTNVARCSFFKFKIYKKLIKIKNSGLLKNVIVKKIALAFITTFLVRPLLVYLLGLDINNNMLHRFVLNIISALTFLCVIDFNLFNSSIKSLIRQITYIIWGYIKTTDIDKRSVNPVQLPEGSGHTGKFPASLYEGGVKPDENAKADIVSVELTDGDNLQRKAQSITEFKELCGCNFKGSHYQHIWPVEKHNAVIEARIDKEPMDSDTKKELKKLIRIDMTKPTDYNALINKLDYYESKFRISSSTKRDITDTVYRAVQVQTSINKKHF